MRHHTHHTTHHNTLHMTTTSCTLNNGVPGFRVHANHDSNQYLIQKYMEDDTDNKIYNRDAGLTDPLRFDDWGSGSYDRVWFGDSIDPVLHTKNTKGNAVLFRVTNNKYMLVRDKIQHITLNSQITHFYSEVWSTNMSRPFAYGDRYMFLFMDECVFAIPVGHEFVKYVLANTKDPFVVLAHPQNELEEQLGSIIPKSNDLPVVVCGEDKPSMASMFASVIGAGSHTPPNSQSSNTTPTEKDTAAATGIGAWPRLSSASGLSSVLYFK